MLLKNFTVNVSNFTTMHAGDLSTLRRLWREVTRCPRHRNCTPFRPWPQDSSLRSVLAVWEFSLKISARTLSTVKTAEKQIRHTEMMSVFQKWMMLEEWPQQRRSRRRWNHVEVERHSTVGSWRHSNKSLRRHTTQTPSYERTLPNELASRRHAFRYQQYFVLA